MMWIGRIWRWGSGGVIGVAVVAYLVLLLFYNFTNLVEVKDFPDDSKESVGDWRKKTTNVLSAVGTNQRWNMFAPNVGTLSYSPIVVIVMKDGSTVVLHSVVEPDFESFTGPGVMPPDADEATRRYSWRFHLGDGRLRKYESRAAKSASNWWKTRTIYTHWRVTKWLEDNPSRREDIKRVELWRSKIRHPGPGRSLHCESVERLKIWPQAMGDGWNLPIEYGFPFYGP